MERAEWLKKMRGMAESLYDHLSPQYWATFGFYENAKHMEFLQKFLELTRPDGTILSAGCGAGRYDGLLLEAGFSVIGTDQSAGMLSRAREHFPAAQYPQLRYERVGLQELDYHAVFDGATCIDALEHVCPEDYPHILQHLSEALKPGGVLYFTVDVSCTRAELEEAYERSTARGMPVVYGEYVEKIEEAYAQVTAENSQSPGDSDTAVYHYYPDLEQVRVWLAEAGMSIDAEGEGSGYHHFLARKKH